MSYKKLTTIPPGEIQELSTDAEMSAVLNSTNIGKAYKFTGTSSTYITGDIYMVESIYNNSLCFTANTQNSTVALNLFGTTTLNQNFTYSTDLDTWVTYTPNTVITLTNIGDKVYFRGNNPNGVSESISEVFFEEDPSDYYYFSMTGSIGASGNVMSLIDNGACDTVVIPNDYCFARLFLQCDCLTSAPGLPATTLTSHCYMQMFRECINLTAGPELPATTLDEYCYYNMFSYSGLTTPMALPATILADACYNAMFEGCESLLTAPALPATSLEDLCYDGMFNDCSSLTTAPTLPATTLANYCYYSMFYGCTSLTTVPSLPAAVLANYCYYYMFKDCASLEVHSSSGTEYSHAWAIPTSGTVESGATIHYQMFYGTNGDYASSGNITLPITVYTQNAPV